LRWALHSFATPSDGTQTHLIEVLLTAWCRQRYDGTPEVSGYHSIFGVGCNSKAGPDIVVSGRASEGCCVRILIVEDDAAMARGLAGRLKLSGFAVDIESDGASAAQTALLEPYRLIILDINLPNVSGFEVLHKIRQAGSTVPVMILTARYAVHDKVSGLDLGADDYLSKPFDIAEFDARVRALVRRGQGLPNPTLICGSLVCDRGTGSITLSGKPLELRRREFAVLEVLMTRAGKLVSKERLIAEVFGFDEPVAPNAAELYVARVRQKIGPDGPRIRTVRGLGYLLEVL
jgi:DNA-binding response OmpR family regulator